MTQTREPPIFDSSWNLRQLTRQASNLTVDTKTTLKMGRDRKAKRVGNKKRKNMKLKNATQLAVIGVIIQLIPPIMYFMINLNLLSYTNSETGQINWYIQYLGILNIIGTALLLTFFITLFKSQK